MRTSSALGNKPLRTVCRFCFTPACPTSPGRCVWQLQMPRGCRAMGWEWPQVSIYPVPPWRLPASSANRGAHPGAPHQAAPGQATVTSMAWGCTGWGSSFVHWELAGFLPPISHGLFLLPPAWALRRSWEIRGLSVPTATHRDDASWTPRTQRSNPKEGSGDHPMRETSGRVGPEPFSSPVPAPGRTQGPPVW